MIYIYIRKQIHNGEMRENGRERKKEKKDYGGDVLMHLQILEIVRNATTANPYEMILDNTSSNSLFGERHTAYIH